MYELSNHNQTKEIEIFHNSDLIEKNNGYTLSYWKVINFMLGFQKL